MGQKQNSPYSIMEAAILFESGAYRLMDRIVTVVTPLEERIEKTGLRRKNAVERTDN